MRRIIKGALVIGTFLALEIWAKSATKAKEKSLDDQVREISRLKAYIQKHRISNLKELIENGVQRTYGLNIKLRNKYSALYSSLDAYNQAHAHQLLIDTAATGGGAHTSPEYDASALSQGGGMHNTDSFLEVIRKMLVKYPEFKAKMSVILSRSEDSDIFSSNKEADVFSIETTDLPSPYSIYERFKDILRAQSILQRELQSELRKVMRYTSILNLRRNDWSVLMEDLLKEMTMLGERKRRTTEEVASMEINNEFVKRYRKSKEILRAGERANKWEEELSGLLEELFPKDLSNDTK